MKSKSGILFFVGFCFLGSVVLAAEEPNAPSIKWLQVFIRADVNEVRFENIWVFERKTADGQWDVSIDLPEGAAGLVLDETNQTLMTGTQSIRMDMAAESLIDSVGFSFSLPNRTGTCRTFMTAGYHVNSMAVSVSGAGTKLVSNVLKPNEYMQSRSRLSGVYTAGDLPAGTRIEITLSRLPRRGNGLAEAICVAGLGLIIITAFLTLLQQKYTEQRR